MEIKTLWLSKKQVALAVQQYASDNFDNGISTLIDVTDTCGSAFDIAEKVNSIDDGYFGIDETRTMTDNLEMIECFVSDNLDDCSRLYLFFIADYFTGLLIIKDEL